MKKELLDDRQLEGFAKRELGGQDFPKPELGNQA